MSTEKKTTTTNAYDPSSMTAFQGMQPGIAQGIASFMNADKTYVPLWQQQANQNIGMIGNRMNSNLSANMTANGFGSGSMPGFMQASLGRNQRALGGMQSNAFLQSMMQGLQLKQQGIQMGEAYHPLQTGGTQTEKTSGTGTWLPQLLGAAGQMAMGAATGGASMAFPGMSAGMISGAFGGPTSAATSGGNNPYLQSNWNPQIGSGGY